MARDIKLIIKGDTRSAEAALKELERTGAQSASIIEREFDHLGIKSDQVFEGKRRAAQDAYSRIRQSGAASASELARAEKGLANQLKAIDEEQYGKRLTMAQKFRNNLGGIVAAAGIAYGAFRIGKEAVEEAKVFESALTDLGKVGVENLGAVRAEIMAMPDELGGATDLVKGYYQTISAGVTEPRKAMELLTTAAKTAKAAHVDQETVIKGLTKVMAGYGGAVATAADAADLLFGIEKLGQTNVAELVPVIGDLASISHQVGVNQYEMGAALSQITQTAGSTAQAATQYRAILLGLLKPTKGMSEALEQMGYSSGQAAIEALGLSGTLTGLEDKATESGVGMGKLFESSEALTGLGPLLNSQFAGYNNALTELQGNAGAADAAFAAWSGTLEATEELFKNTIGKVMIELGTELAPTVNEALKGVAGWIRDNKGEIVAFVQGLGTVVEGVAAAAGVAINLVRDAANLAAELDMQLERNLNTTGALSNFRVENIGSTISNFFGGGSSITDRSDGPLFPDTGSSFATGARYVPRTGFYQLHRGEEVRTRGEVSRGSAGVTLQMGDLNVTVSGAGSADPRRAGEQIGEAAARRLYEKFREYDRRYARA